MSVEVTPTPSEEEAVAIVAALDAAWPRAVTAAPAADTPRWRFAGRWWTRPIPIRRERPW